MTVLLYVRLKALYSRSGGGRDQGVSSNLLGLFTLSHGDSSGTAAEKIRRNVGEKGLMFPAVGCAAPQLRAVQHHS